MIWSNKAKWYGTKMSIARNYVFDNNLNILVYYELMSHIFGIMIVKAAGCFTLYIFGALQWGCLWGQITPGKFGIVPGFTERINI